MNRVAIVGSRTFVDKSYFDRVMYVLSTVIERPSLIVSGGAKGADTSAEMFASESGIPAMVFRPDWKAYGRRAGPLRNTQIVNSAEMIIAFWDEASKGTGDSIVKAIQEKKVVIVANFLTHVLKQYNYERGAFDVLDIQI